MRIGYLDLIRSRGVTSNLELDLDGRGSLKVLDQRIVTVTLPIGSPVHIEARTLLEGTSELHYAFDPETGRMILVGLEGKDVYLLDVRSQQLTLVTSLRRWADPVQQHYDPGGLYQLEFIEIEDGILLAHECGITRMDLNGCVRWRHEHTCFSFRDGVEAGAIWYQSEREGHWGYRLEDGQRLEPPNLLPK